MATITISCGKRVDNYFVKKEKSKAPIEIRCTIHTKKWRLKNGFNQSNELNDRTGVKWAIIIIIIIINLIKLANDDDDKIDLIWSKYQLSLLLLSFMIFKRQRQRRNEKKAHNNNRWFLRTNIFIGNMINNNKWVQFVFVFERNNIIIIKKITG